MYIKQFEQASSKILVKKKYSQEISAENVSGTQVQKSEEKKSELKSLRQRTRGQEKHFYDNFLLFIYHLIYFYFTFSSIGCQTMSIKYKI